MARHGRIPFGLAWRLSFAFSNTRLLSSLVMAALKSFSSLFVSATDFANEENRASATMLVSLAGFGKSQE